MSIDAMKQALEVLSLELPMGSHLELKNALRAAIEQPKQNRAKEMRDAGYTRRPTLREFPREDAQPEQDARAHHKMMVAMMQAHWRRIDLQWKDDPELCHALGYEAGYKDAVARRVEPRESGGSGAGFESLPASPTWWDDPVPQMRREWQGLTDEERNQFRQWAHPDIIEAIELRLQERNT